MNSDRLPIHRNESACQVSEMCIEDLHAERLIHLARISSLEEDVEVYRQLVILMTDDAIRHRHDNARLHRELIEARRALRERIAADRSAA